MNSHLLLCVSLALLLVCAPIAAASDILSDTAKEKLHPALHQLFEEHQRSGRVLSADTLVDAIVYTDDPLAVRAAGIEVNSVYHGFLTARVYASQLASLVSLTSVHCIDPGSVNTVHTELGVPETGASMLHGGLVGGVPYTGDGVIVAIYDTGIDWQHPDFRSPTDPTQSRILAIWDQTLSAQGGESAPSGFGYGVEYTQAQINDEIDGSPSGAVRERDIHGHGTHVAGIAAGNGAALGGKYTGMAPDADILVIKGGDGSFSESRMIDGLSYAGAVAAAYGRPVVVNFSIGGQSGPHDGTRSYEVAIDQFCGTSGRAVVVSAGNDGSIPMHAALLIGPGETHSFTFTVPSYTPRSGTENDAFFFDLWSNGNHNLTATVISPNGISYTRTAGQTGDGPNASDGTITLWNYTSGLNGQRNIQMWIHDKTAQTPRSGVWTLTLTNEGEVEADCHGWLTMRSVGSATVTVTGGNTDRTVSMPGTSNAAITVGSYVTKWGWPSYTGVSYSYGGSDRTGNISTFSSIGPTRDGRLKPEIAAPGQGISSALSASVDTTGDYSIIHLGEKHWLMQGTSMAAPHVTGGVALLLDADPSLTNDQIRDLLTGSAVSDGFTAVVPNPIWGEGKFDVFRALVRRLFPAADVSRTTVAYDGTGSSTINSVTGTQKAGVRFVAPVDGRLAALRINITSNAGSALIGTGDVLVEVFSALNGVPHTRLGQPVSVPLGLLHRGILNSVSMLDAQVHMVAGTEYVVVVSVVQPADALGLRSDVLTVPPSTSMWYNGSSWTLWSTGHLRIQSVLCTDLWTTPIASRTVTVSGGWNIVCVPADVPQMHVDSLFPGHASSAFGFSTAYVPEDTLAAGRGYWMKFSGASAYGIIGNAVRPADVPVDSGWNLLGPLDAMLAAASVSSTPPGLVLTPFYGFSGGYREAAMLASGSGYWVKTSSAGVLHMAGAIPKGGTAPPVRRPDWLCIVVRDGSGETRSVALAPAGEITGSFELPPLPPAGVLDVRTAAGKSVDTLGSGLYRLLVRSSVPPLVVGGENLSGRAYEVRSRTGSVEQGWGVLADGTTLELGTPVDEIMLREVHGGAEVPTDVALFQNYPNPFNPATTIPFAVPWECRVRLEVFDLTGARRDLLIDDRLAPGSYTAVWEPHRAASGVYLCRMTIDGGTSVLVSKLVYMK